MVETWLVELLKGTGKLFLHPVLYYLVFLTGILGVTRVKRERKNFHVRAHDAYFELRQLFPQGVLIGLVLSIIVVAAGIAVPFATILLIAVFTFLWSLTTNIRWISPAYTIGAAFFAIILIAENNWSIPLFTKSFQALGDKVYPSVVVVLGLMLIAEGILIFKNGGKGTSPKLAKSKRGQNVGLHEGKRLWMLPLFLLIPGNALQLPFDWWPVFHLGSQEYSLILVPFAIGFHQKVKGMLPKVAIQLHGRRVIALGVFVTLLSVAGYWLPLSSIVVAALAVLGRELITLMTMMKDDNLPFYFSKKNQGLMIIGVIPESPASKMGLQVGEIISKANGLLVRDEKVFYEALQKNRAHCKLEVLDTNGEIRLLQRALYEGDHHELGILFVQDERKYDEKIG
ncbi:PDZ domain-containing protein [Bacillus sp. ISL-40]|uniref:PDZ domain-containing protein n=1 Tax=unclassified Bacillus (in: firmicutes) TaxID=185979 RepID=UPI001BE9281A|nr:MULTISPECIES: PDZ domain-containing protein [unclassified Bacillus (in: firmicutes)]MBT2698179.1 PDZ domain-containing protein [Bacillus sp. ISL-40]MBT2741999.1 PDZ domain-containing protein [Bacillus sp. ISL-77]